MQRLHHCTCCHPKCPKAEQVAHCQTLLRALRVLHIFRATDQGTPSEIDLHTIHASRSSVRKPRCIAMLPQHSPAHKPNLPKYLQVSRITLSRTFEHLALQDEILGAPQVCSPCDEGCDDGVFCKPRSRQGQYLAPIQVNVSKVGNTVCPYVLLAGQF